jgi:hypothetical protein
MAISARRQKLVEFIYQQPRPVIDCLLRMYATSSNKPRYAHCTESVEDLITNLPCHQLKIIENILHVCVEYIDIRDSIQ